MTPEAEEHQPIEDWPMPTREVLLTLRRAPAWDPPELVEDPPQAA